MLRPRAAIITAGVVATLLSAGCTAQAPATPSPSAPPIAAIYRGPAACDGCPEAVAEVLGKSGGFSVEFVGPDEERSVTPDGLADVTLYVQPGGHDDVGLAMEQLGETATETIPAWVEDGGRYLGFCMGAYLAGSDPGMGMLSPGDTAGYAETAG